jgi:hypothetical protein
VKLLKYLSLAMLALGLALSLFAAWLVLTFDARDYTPRIAALVKDKTARTLIFRGEPHLSFWPDLALTLGPVALTERDSDVVFAEVGDAHVVVELRPLLDGRIVADELRIEGANVHILRGKDGRLNIDDLLSGERGTLAFDIARARVERSRVTFEDLGRGARHEIADIRAITGRLARGAAAPVTLAFSARDAAEAYALRAQVEGVIAFDLDNRRYTLTDAKAKVDGRLARVHDIEATIAAQRLRVADGGIGADAIAATVKSGALRANVNVPRIEWRDNVVAAAGAVFDIDAPSDGREMHAKLTADVRADTANATLELAGVRSTVALSGRGLPRRGIAGELTGTVRSSAEHSEAVLSGTVGGSAVKAKLTTAGYASAPYAFAIDVGMIDLDRFGGAGASRGGSFDLAALGEPPAAGTVRIGVLKSGGVVAKNVRLAVTP